MRRLSLQQILAKIKTGEPFEAVSQDYSFTIKIESYVPFICAAIHDGHQFRKPLWENCLHTEYERWYEEDPETKQMIHSHPIVLAGRDSRFEYDLNRHPDTAIYEDAWGKKLWRTPLKPNQRKLSLEKHATFYKVVNALITKIETMFGQCIVFDMHSYNWKRWDRKVPTWNIGTANLDTNRFGKVIELWRSELSKIVLPHDVKSTSKINDTFLGNGYFLKYITQHFNNTLVLATEIAKIYCDELNQIIYPEVVKAIETDLKHRIPDFVNEAQTQF